MAEVGLATFVGRVRGALPPDDAAWVEATSDAIEDLRAALIDAVDRMVEAGDGLGCGLLAEPFRTADDELTAWEQLTVWADAINAAVVGTVATDDEVPVRWADLGRLLREVRGEQVVDELLTAGVLPSPPGTTGAVAFAEHGAWDIELLGRGGATLARADVVITDDGAGVVDHLARRPGVDLVYTTSDAVDALTDDESVRVVRPGGAWPSEGSGGTLVVDIGVRSDALRAEVDEALGGDPRHSAEALLEAVPVLALLLVATRSAVRVAATDDAGADITTDAGQQAWDVVTSAGVAQLVGWASGLNLLKVPATLTFVLGRAAVRDARASVELSGRRVARARRLIAGTVHTP